jgi:hypothetical protein
VRPIRQSSGEIAPSSWITGAGLLAGMTFFSYQSISGLSVLILTLAFGIATALCILAAGRQHYINVGMERDRVAPAHPMEAEKVLELPVLVSERFEPEETRPKQQPPKIEFVGVESRARVVGYRNGYVRWTSFLHVRTCASLRPREGLRTPKRTPPRVADGAV